MLKVDIPADVGKAIAASLAAAKEGKRHGFDVVADGVTYYYDEGQGYLLIVPPDEERIVKFFTAPSDELSLDGIRVEVHRYVADPT